MTKRHYSSKGIILHRKNYGEADRILIIYTENYGKIKAIAKGVRKTGSRKRGHIEVFSLIKFSASGNSDLPIITEVETVNNFSQLRSNLTKTALGYYFVEIIEKITREDEKNEIILNILINYLKRLEQGTNYKTLKGEFLKNVLFTSGFIPPTDISVDYDLFIEEVLERKIKSSYVGKKMLI